MSGTVTVEDLAKLIDLVDTGKAAEIILGTEHDDEDEDEEDGDDE